MKFICTSLLLLLFSVASYAQNCTNPVNYTVFQQKLNQVAMAGNDQNKLNIASPFAGNTCMTSNQVMLLSSQFVSDAYRLEFCKVAWSHTSDPVNFYDVYDSFNSFSYALRLRDFISGTGHTGGTSNPIEVEEPVSQPHVFPMLSYPTTINYQGQTGCSTPLTDHDFAILVENVVKQPTDESKLIAAQTMASTHCLTMAQLMKVATLFEVENFALQFMESAFWSTYDLENYNFAAAVFTNSTYQNNWRNFCVTQLTPVEVVPEEPVITCDVSAADFGPMKASVNDASFADDKKSTIRVLNNDNCFSTAQINQLVSSFSFPRDKMEMVKLLHGKCTDKKNYYKLKSVFTFSSDQNAFMEWLQGQ